MKIDVYSAQQVDINWFGEVAPNAQSFNRRKSLLGSCVFRHDTNISFFFFAPADCISALKAEKFKILCAKPATPSKDTSRSPIPLKAIDFGEKTAVYPL